MAKHSRAARKNSLRPSASTSPPTADDGLNLWHEPLVQVLLIIAAGFTVYSTIITAPFLFDDFPYLVNNPAIRSFSYFADTSRISGLDILEDVKNNIILRPVPYFTFALNYALHGLDVRGYHLVNLLVHLANGLLIYHLLTLTLRAPAMTSGDATSDDSLVVRVRYLPLFCAMLFVCHPLQTQAVTYIIQRCTSLAATFCLAALTFYAQFRLAERTMPRWTWYALALCSTLLAMNTKENAFTLPLLIALYELLFFEGRVARRFVLLLPLLLTMALIPIRLTHLAGAAQPDEADLIADAVNLVNFGRVSQWDYLMTQFGVIVTYLRLIVLPVGQNFDYDLQLQTHFFSLPVLLPLGGLLVLFGVACHLVFRTHAWSGQTAPLARLTAFGIFWFFIMLAVESSIIPIDDLIFEHRAYLPSTGIFISALAGLAALYGQRTGRAFFASRTAIITLTTVVFCLSAATLARNRLWGDAVAFWSDVASKSPNKARVHNSLGFSLFNQGDPKAGIEAFRTAIRLRPTLFRAHINLGNALLEQKEYDQAAQTLQTAMKLRPNSPAPHNLLGLIFERKGDLATARWEYLTAIRIAPGSATAHRLLGELYEREGRYPEALSEFAAALSLFPDETLRRKIAVLGPALRDHD